MNGSRRILPNCPTKNDPSRGPGKDHKGDIRHLKYVLRNLTKPQTAKKAAASDRKFVVVILPT